MPGGREAAGHLRWTGRAAVSLRGSFRGRWERSARGRAACAAQRLLSCTASRAPAAPRRTSSGGDASRTASSARGPTAARHPLGPSLGCGTTVLASAAPRRTSSGGDASRSLRGPVGPRGSQFGPRSPSTSAPGLRHGPRGGPGFRRADPVRSPHLGRRSGRLPRSLRSLPPAEGCGDGRPRLPVRLSGLAGGQVLHRRVFDEGVRIHGRPRGHGARVGFGVCRRWVPRGPPRPGRAAAVRVGGALGPRDPVLGGRVPRVGPGGRDAGRRRRARPATTAASGSAAVRSS